MTGLSRRSLVRAAAALPALAVPAAVAAMAPPAVAPGIARPAAATPDPIFAAIKRYRRADRRWDRANYEFDQAAYAVHYKLPYRGEVARLEAKKNLALNAYDASMEALTKVQPTTAAGVAALVTCVRQSLKIGETPWHGAVLANVIRALKAMPEQAMA
jgi:hypothetical protein